MVLHVLKTQWFIRVVPVRDIARILNFNVSLVNKKDFVIIFAILKVRNCTRVYNVIECMILAPRLNRLSLLFGSLVG